MVACESSPKITAAVAPPLGIRSQIPAQTHFFNRQITFKLGKVIPYTSTHGRPDRSLQR